MGKNTIKLTINEKKFLKTILKYGSVADTFICKETGLSKSTCSRIRKKLEKNLISEYIPIIDLYKVGINVFLVLTFQWNAFNNKQLTKRAFSEFKLDSRVIFLANGEGSNISTVIFMGFKDLEEYHNHLKNFKREYGSYVSNVNSLLLPSKEVIKNDFTEIIKKVLEEEK